MAALVGAPVTSALARAIARGLRGAVAVMLLAMAGAVLFPESEGERFATTAYLAAIFTVVLLVVWRCIPERERSSVSHAESSKPAVVAFWLSIGAGLSAATSLATSLTGEVLVGLLCAIAIVSAALFPRGLFAPLHREVAKGGGLRGMTRYAVVLGIAAWAVGAAFPAIVTTTAICGFAMLATAGMLTIASLRPLEEIIAFVVIVAVVAFVVVALVPVAASIAEGVGCTATMLLVGLLVVRERYASSRGESLRS
jgi:hypothetical protein